LNKAEIIIERSHVEEFVPFVRAKIENQAQHKFGVHLFQESEDEFYSVSLMFYVLQG